MAGRKAVELPLLAGPVDAKVGREVRTSRWGVGWTTECRNAGKVLRWHSG